jgi:hypothetical protein
MHLLRDALPHQPRLTNDPGDHALHFLMSPDS